MIMVTQDVDINIVPSRGMTVKLTSSCSGLVADDITYDLPQQKLSLNIMLPAGAIDDLINLGWEVLT